MNELLACLATLLGVIISIVVIARLLFYTKAEINTKLQDVNNHSDEKDEMLRDFIIKEFNVLNTQLETNKDKTYEKLLNAEREGNHARQELYDRMAQNKQVFEDYNKNMLEVIAQIRQEDRDLSNKYIQLLNEVKDELKNDYINRYNELLQIINTKVNVPDFDRLEHKFDKVSETITELKTIVQMQIDSTQQK